MSGDNLTSSACTSSRSLLTTNASDDSAAAVLRPGVDLVAAARRNVTFLRHVADSDWLHHGPTAAESIRRYDQLWMPLISDLTAGASAPAVVPPFDVEWIWFCHSLNPVHYEEYCASRFSKVLGNPAIFDEENEEYAFSRCRQIWSSRYPNEPFDNETDPDSEDPVVTGLYGDLLAQVCKKRVLLSLFLEPYKSETLYLMAARRRYQKFLSLLLKFSDNCSCLVPAVDILLIWITHMSYPTVYAADTKHIEDSMVKVLGPWEPLLEEHVEETKKLWQSAFDQPYEKAGAMIPMDLRGGGPVTVPTLYWVASDSEDVNTKYKSMRPRFLLEVCVYVRLMYHTSAPRTEKAHEFLRLGTLKSHRELKLDKPISQFSPDSWQKAWHLYCEFGTKGLMLELRHSGSLCFKGTGLLENASVQWNDLLRASSLGLAAEIARKVKIFTSITPPVQAPYLLKCVPDRVTDDSGAMISDVILRLNQYRPQEGRWLTRTVLDHAGHECFVVRIRIGGGFWRRGGESPQNVRWEDRIIEIREGSWSYVADSIGRAPEKIVGRAMPKEESLSERRTTWCFSSGEELTVEWDSTATISSLSFTINIQNSSQHSVKLLKGRRMQYERSKEVSEEEEAGFATLVRYSDDSPNGKATALLNWRRLVVELLPEEDAAFALLVSMAVLRSVSEMKKEDVGGLLVRRRLREMKVGSKDWGSVMVPASEPHSASLEPWYWRDNASRVVAQDGGDKAAARQPVLMQSLVEGGDKLYKRGIMS